MRMQHTHTQTYTQTVHIHIEKLYKCTHTSNPWLHIGNRKEEVKGRDSQYFLFKKNFF